MTGCYRPLLDDIGLTYSQYAVMLVLWERQETTMRELGVALHLDSGTLSPLVKRLERLGLITRTRDPHDERILEVAITDAGRVLRPRAAAAQRSVEAMTSLDRAELARMRDELNTLADRMRLARGSELDAPESAA